MKGCVYASLLPSLYDDMLEAGVPPRVDMVGGDVDEEREEGALLSSRPGMASAEGGEMDRFRVWLMCMGRRAERRELGYEEDSVVKRSRSER